MLLISWNVAGLTSTLHRINDSYGGHHNSIASAAASASTSRPEEEGSRSKTSVESEREAGGVTSTAATSVEEEAKADSSNGVEDEDGVVDARAVAVPLPQPRRRVSSGASAATTTPKPPRTHALSHYLTLHHSPTILCLQEHKISHPTLSSRSEPLGCACLPGYESFWSCCTSSNHKGFNGVVTYAKIGTVREADVTPLGEKELDEQGRCVMTDHGTFVVFNVYVPAGGGQPLSYKMRFLNALRRAMRGQRSLGKAVMLVGDLNIAVGARDVYWKNRLVDVGKVIEDVREGKRRAGMGAGEVPRWKREVEKSWNFIEEVLETKEVVATQTKNSKTGEEFSKFRLRVTVNDKPIYLGKHEESESSALWYYDFDQVTYYDEDEERDIVVLERNVMSVEKLSELMLKIGGVEWEEVTERLIATTEGGNICPTKPTVRWLKEQIMEQDGMVDCFRHFYPTAEGRFTCWSQQTNMRYVNVGIRIDYTLIDKCLLPHLQKGQVKSLRSGGNSSNNIVNNNTTAEDGEDPLSESAALRAATANGMFQPVSFEGGGIVPHTQRALDTQFGTMPHTGIVYTPPSFSDHVATSLLLNDELLESKGLVLDEKDVKTKRAQPHKAQRSIASFFGTKKRPANVSSSSCLTTMSDSSSSTTVQGNWIANKRQTSVERSNNSMKSFLSSYSKCKQKENASLLLRRQGQSSSSSTENNERRQLPPPPVAAAAVVGPPATKKAKKKKEKNDNGNRSSSRKKSKGPRKMKQPIQRNNILNHFSK